jgi:hypothetical protein
MKLTKVDAREGGLMKMTRVDEGGGGGLMKLTKVDEGGGGGQKVPKCG